MTNPISFTLDGHQMAYSVAGDPIAPPLIMVHGWGSYRGVWRQTVGAFRDKYFCVAVDLLGFGDSDRPPDADYSITAQGERILKLADSLGFEQFTLMGHSMGGQIALCTASTLAPERIARLVSVAGVVTGRLTDLVEHMSYPWIARARKLPRLYNLWRWMTRSRRLAYVQFRPWFYRMDALPFDTWRIDREMFNRRDGYISIYEAGQAIHNLDLTPHLANIVAPTLAIFGQQDGTVPVADGHLVDNHVPDSRLVLIDECGHFPMYEKSAEYLAALRNFLL